MFVIYIVYMLFGAILAAPYTYVVDGESFTFMCATVVLPILVMLLFFFNQMDGILKKIYCVFAVYFLSPLFFVLLSEVLTMAGMNQFSQMIFEVRFGLFFLTLALAVFVGVVILLCAIWFGIRPIFSKQTNSS